MVKRLFFVPLVLSGFLLFAGAVECLADVSSELELAQTHEKSGDYDQAERIYKQIVTDYPGTDDALEAQKRLTILYITIDKQSSAEAAFQQLVADFNDNEHVARIVNDIGHKYSASLNYGKADQCYQYVLDHWPGDEHAMWTRMDIARMGIALKEYDNARGAFQNIIDSYPDQEHAIWAQSELARMELQLGNDDAAEAIISNLKTAYGKDAFTAHALHDIAFMYHQKERYADAQTLFSYILDNYPGNEYERWALGGLAAVSLKLGDIAAGDAAAERLAAEFSGHKDMAILAYDVATGYMQSKNYSKAKEFFELSLASNPQPEHRMRSMDGLAKAKLQLGKYSQANFIVDTMLSEHPDDPNAAFEQADTILAKGLYGTAKRYQQLGKFDEAARIYALMAEKLPSGDWGRKALLRGRMVEVVGLIDSGQHDSALTRIEQVKTEFADQSDLGGCVMQMAEEFYVQGCGMIESDANKAAMLLNTAIEVWEGQISENLLPEYGSSLFYMLGYAYRQLKQYESAIVYFEKAVADYPDFESRPDAMFQTARCYKKMMENGQIPEAQAKERMRDIYQNIVDCYPECKAIPVVRRWLKSND